MNPPELNKLVFNLDLESDGSFQLRVAFGIACIDRVRHLLTEQQVIECLETGERKVWDTHQPGNAHEN